MSSEGKCGGDGKDDGGEGWLHLEFEDIELGDKIGGGGVGIIYNGWFGDQPVAVKTLMDTRLDETLKQEYLDELLIMSRLKHSNIVTFIGACMKPPNLCFLMELCEGKLLLIYICNFHVLSHLLLIYICKLHWKHLCLIFFIKIKYISLPINLFKLPLISLRPWNICIHKSLLSFTGINWV